MPVNSFENYPMSWKPILQRNKKALYLALAEELENDIHAGRLRPGTKLPPQRELADFLAGFARGIAHRGKCQLGDRTILDAVDAGARKAQEACAEGADMGAMLRRAAEGAKEGVKATEDMLPKYGKAAVFSAKAKGVPDQGAVAGQYFLEGLGRYFL